MAEISKEAIELWIRYNGDTDLMARMLSAADNELIWGSNMGDLVTLVGSMAMVENVPVSRSVRDRVYAELADFFEVPEMLDYVRRAFGVGESLSFQVGDFVVKPLRDDSKNH